MITDYIQTSDIDTLIKYLETLKKDGGAVVELTVHGEPKFHFSDYVEIVIDGKVTYSFDFKSRVYKVDNTEFYLTAMEARNVLMYLKNFNASVVPHWWPYAERNIMRHGDPLKKLKDSMRNGRNIEIVIR